MAVGQEKGQEEATLQTENGMVDGGFQTIQPEETVGDLKRAKAATKTALTKVRRYLLILLQRQDVNRQAIENSCDELDYALEKEMGT